MGLLQGEEFASLFSMTDREKMEQMIDEVTWAPEGAYATEKGEIGSTGRVLRIEAVCVGGGESSGRDSDFRVLLGVEELEEDEEGKLSDDVEALRSQEGVTGETRGLHHASGDLPGAYPATGAAEALSAVVRREDLPVRRFFLTGGQEGRRGCLRADGRSIASDDLLRNYGLPRTGMAETSPIPASPATNVEEGSGPVVQAQGVETPRLVPISSGQGQDLLEEESV